MGDSVLQMLMTFGQRPAKRQPGLTLTAEGISPVIVVEARLRSLSGSGSGFEAINKEV